MPIVADEDFVEADYPHGFGLLFVADSSDCSYLRQHLEEHGTRGKQKVLLVECDARDPVELEDNYDIEVHPSLYWHEDRDVLTDPAEILEHLESLE